MSWLSTEFVEQLFRRHDRSLQRYLRGRTPANEVADLANECYLRMLAVQNPAGIREPEAFLLRTARNLAIDRSRRSALEVTSDTLPAEPDTMPGDAASPEDCARSDQLQEALETALAALPERSAVIFRLRRFQGHSSAAIASDLGLSQRAVQKHLAKALVFIELHLRPFLRD